MKILSKGLILVGVPLLFGVVFISLLYFGVSQANRLVRSELNGKDSIVTYVTAARCSVCAVRYGAVYRSTQNADWHERAEFNEKMSTAAEEHLKKLHESDPSLPIPTLKIQQPEAPLFTPGTGFAKHLAELGKIVLGQNQVSLGGLADATLPLQEICDERTDAAAGAMSFLRGSMVLGLILELIVSIALTVFFCVSITNRLKKILGDISNFSKGVDLEPPLKGVDEIAELDRCLYDSAAQMRQLERFKREMIGVVGQELKNPLYEVGTFLTSLRDGMYGALSTKSAQRIATSCASVQRLIVLIADLFTLGRTELLTTPSKVKTKDLIYSAINNVQELLDKSGLKVEVKSDESSFVVDSDRLIQVIVNLVSNAMKFSPAGSTILIEAARENDWLEFRIKDQGPGIPDAFRRTIFEPFKQVDGRTAVAKKGTGLGLTISRTIVEQHGGTIGVDSVEGNGSTFWFRLPASPDLIAKHTTDTESNPRNITIPKMKFSVLKQGLLIIAVPLIFQVVFISMLGGMLQRINDHNDREEVSQKLLLNVNEAGDSLLEATRFAMVFMYTKEKIYYEMFQTELDKGVKHIDESKALLVADPEGLKDLAVCRKALTSFPDNVKHEAIRLGEKYSTKPSGAFATMNEFLELIKDPDHPSKALLDKIHTLVEDKVHLQTYQPFFDAQDAMEQLISRENATGKTLANQRDKLLILLNGTLLGGIGLATILSLLLANFLVRNLIRRVRLVMDNTARIVGREPLMPPTGGFDEIAFLDRVLCETGNHLIELERFKHSLIAIVSHEIRTPLSAVCITLELVEAGVMGELTEAGSSKLQVVEAEAQDLVRLINDLLDLEKMAAGQFVLDHADFKVDELIEQSSTAVIPLAKSRDIKLDLGYPPDGLSLKADRDRLSHALINLLSSRIKTSPENSAVELQILHQTNELEFRVTDHSGGIPDDLKSKIFDRFVQVENPEARQFAGSGLTLVIAKAIVEQHGGTIGVESEAGEGSTFWFKLPTRV